jgi:hypothetical protein
MVNIKGNLWNHVGVADAICITTNGFVKNNGECVMGRGCAKEATLRYPGIARKLGNLIVRKGNHCFVIKVDQGTRICSFPVKHNWWEEADIKLIIHSCKELIALADKKNWTNIVIPRPGCGNGKLSYSDVEPILQQHLDDRFAVITF